MAQPARQLDKQSAEDSALESVRLVTHVRHALRLVSQARALNLSIADTILCFRLSVAARLCGAGVDDLRSRLASVTPLKRCGLPSGDGSVWWHLRGSGQLQCKAHSRSRGQHRALGALLSPPVSQCTCRVRGALAEEPQHSSACRRTEHNAGHYF